MAGFWLAIIGCGTATPPPSVEADADTDADSDSDTDADADADADSDTDTDADTDADTDTDTDVQQVTGATGAFTLFHFQPGAVLGDDEQMVLVGLFTDDDQGFLNPNECFPLLYNACVEQLPTGPDGWIDLQLDYDGGAASSLDGGGTLLLGVIATQRQYDAIFGHFYRTTFAPPYPADQTLALSLSDGAFGTFFGAGEITTPPPMVLHEPDPYAEPARLMDGEQLHFAWEPDPTGESQVELLITSTGEPNATPVRRLYSLVDDGGFDLDVDSLGLAGANRELIASIARVRREVHDVNGNVMRVGARSEARVALAHPDLQGRIAIGGSETCTEAPLVGPGRYHGDLTGREDSFGLPADSCTGTEDTGPDQVVAIALQPGERLRATAEIFADDAALYLLTDCADPSGACVAGSDYADAAGAETVTWTHTGTEPATVYLVVDSQDAEETLFLLDVVVDEPAPTNPLPDDCATALGVDPIDTSTDLVVDLQAAIDHLDPFLNSCAGHAAPGPDRMVPVQIGPGQTFSARAEGAAVLYLLEDCTNEGSCQAGAPPYGELYDENLSTVAQQRYLVVDDPGEPGVQGPMDVHLTFGSLDTLFPVDTCSELANAPLLVTGDYTLRGTVDGFTDALDLEDPGPSCTGYASSGDEGLARVRLQPGQSIEVEYAQDEPGDGVVYLLTDCNDTTSAVACDDKINGTERIRYDHAGAGPIELTLVLDNWSGGPWAPPSGAFELRVTIE